MYCWQWDNGSKYNLTWKNRRIVPLECCSLHDQRVRKEDIWKRGRVENCLGCAVLCIVKFAREVGKESSQGPGVSHEMRRAQIIHARQAWDKVRSCGG